MQQMTNYNDNYIEYDWSFIFLFTFGCLCQQGNEEVTRY